MNSDLFTFTRGAKREGCVLIIGEAWGKDEADAKLPFVGASGKELNNMLTQAGIPLGDCLFANVVNARPLRNNMKSWLTLTVDARKAKTPTYRGIFPDQIILENLDRLHTLIAHARPRLIIALGAWALWAVTDKYKIGDDDGFKLPGGIDSYRGSMLYTDTSLSIPRTPVLPTYHPAGILRNWKWHHVAMRDLRRASAFLHGALPWDDTREFKWLIKPTVREVRAWVDRFLGRSGETIPLVLDLETAAYQIHIFGVKNPDDGTCMCLPFFDLFAGGRKATYSFQEFVAIYGHLRRLLTDPRVRLVGQNLIYDIQYLSWFFCYTPIVGDDTMVMQYVISPGERKGLDFLASVYCTYYVYWKDDRKVSLEKESTELGCMYNCLDLEYTDEVWRKLRPALPRMNKETQYLKRIKLLHQLFRMMQYGVKQDLANRRMQAKYLDLKIEQVEQWLDGAMPDFLKPPRKQSKSGKWDIAPWYRSDKQLRDIFYGQLKLRPVWDEKTKKPTLAKGALGKLARRYPDLKVIFNVLVLLRSLNTYKENFYDARVSRDGRMRSAYNPAGPVSLRLASSEDVFGDGHNTQNVPRDRNPLTFFNIIEELS